ncbi:MAG: hypothetical protein Aurels2KO_37960 [Aureliella sp.]
MIILKYLPKSAALVAALLTVAGCNQQERRYAVSGTVSLEGKPIDDVTIVFTPEGEGLSGAAEVTDGKFACSEKSGPTAGIFNVRISPNEAEMEEVEEDLSALATPRKPRVPLKYQRLGGLQVEITGEESQVLDIELER